MSNGWISMGGTNHGWPMGTRFSYSDQDIILDKDLNIIVVRYYPVTMVS